MNQLSGHLNDVPNFSIDAFSEFEAKNFISRLDIHENVLFTEEHIQYILKKISWHLPFFIQIWVAKIDSLIYMEEKQLSIETIDEAYNLLIMGKDFNHWDERLKYYYDYEDNARKILKLCTVQTGRSREDLLANLSRKKSDIEKIDSILGKLLYMLQNDGYIVEKEGKYIFRSPMLRDFWYNRFIL
jgi:hypothetical protein